jgi:hypothetical protein
MAKHRPRDAVDPKRRKRRTPPKRRIAFDPRWVAQATRLASEDWTDVEIAAFFKISPRQLYRYKIDYPAFAKAFVRGEEQRTRMVENAHFQRAVGIVVPATKILQHQGKPIIIPYEEHLPPDVNAQISYLKAYKPGRYRERLELGSDPTMPIRFIIDGRDETPAPPKAKESKLDGKRRKGR